MAKIKKYSEEELRELKTKALDMIDTIKVSRGRKSESADFLLSIKEVIKKALDKEIPFTQITKLIKDAFSIDISVNILKSFAKKELNYEPRKRNNTLNKNKEKPTTMQEMKEVIKNKSQEEDSL